MEEKKLTRKSKETANRFWSYVGVLVLLFVALAIALSFYKQRVEIQKEVFKNLTEDWQTFKSDKYGISFKYPKDWTVSDGTALGVDYTLTGEYAAKKNTGIRIRVAGQRSVGGKDPGDAIQISIPFDKKNYLIFSTSTNNEEKEVFYNIPVTLEIKR